MRTRLTTLIAYVILLMMATCGGCSRPLSRDLVNAAYVGDVGEIETLIQKGANPEALAIDGWTPLTMAAREGHLEAVDILLRYGAKIDAPEGGGNTALFLAAFYNRRDVVKSLLAKGADSTMARGGETALHVAIRLNHSESADLLRQAGAKE